MKKLKYLKLFENFNENFVKVDNIDMLINFLKEHIGENAVIHFNCKDCNDEQVTYEIEIDDDFINSVETNRYLVLGYDCTECGQKQNIVDENDIYGIEII